LPWPPARNPWNLGHHPGGSSSGSGVAVAAGFMPAALGTDSGGSVRNPASMCGIVGMKPTYGLVSRKGVLPLSYSLDTVGPMTRNVEDNAILLEAIAGHDSDDPASVNVPTGRFTRSLDAGVDGLRIGYIRHFHEVDLDDADPDMLASLDAAAETFSELGAEVREVSVKPLDDYAAVNRVILLTEGYSIHEEWLKARPGDYGSLARQRLLPGAFIRGADYVSALRTRGEFVRAFSETMRDLDVVICASSMEPASKIDNEAEVARGYQRQARMVFNLLGNPAIALPTGFSKANLPLAMQIVGKPFQEDMVFRVAHAYEAAIRWNERRPDLSELPVETP
ncbi:MAG: amidase, partial [Propionibacteriales bacterium]|nr:amidase [Propionibacteriales bacterium]